MDYLARPENRSLQVERTNSRRDILASEADIAKSWLRARPADHTHLHVSYKYANSEGFSERADLDITTD